MIFEKEAINNESHVALSFLKSELLKDLEDYTSLKEEHENTEKNMVSTISRLNAFTGMYAALALSQLLPSNTLKIMASGFSVACFLIMHTDGYLNNISRKEYMQHIWGFVVKGKSYMTLITKNKKNDKAQEVMKNLAKKETKTMLAKVYEYIRHAAPKNEFKYSQTHLSNMFSSYQKQDMQQVFIELQDIKDQLILDLNHLLKQEDTEMFLKDYLKVESNLLKNYPL